MRVRFSARRRTLQSAKEMGVVESYRRGGSKEDKKAYAIAVLEDDAVCQALKSLACARLFQNVRAEINKKFKGLVWATRRTGSPRMSSAALLASWPSLAGGGRRKQRRRHPNLGPTPGPEPLMGAAGKVQSRNYIYPADIGSSPQPRAGGRRVQSPGGARSNPTLAGSQRRPAFGHVISTIDGALSALEPWTMLPPCPAPTACTY